MSIFTSGPCDPISSNVSRSQNLIVLSAEPEQNKKWPAAKVNTYNKNKQIKLRSPISLEKQILLHKVARCYMKAWLQCVLKQNKKEKLNLTSS